MLGRQPVERLPPVPAEQAVERVYKIAWVDVRQAALALDQRREPVVDGENQGPIRQIRQLTAMLGGEGGAGA